MRERDTPKDLRQETCVIWLQKETRGCCGGKEKDAKKEPAAKSAVKGKDEKKGNDDSRLMESLNLIGSKKIIENEIEVLKSRPVIETAIKKLHLYAEVYIKKGLKNEYLFSDAPFYIEAYDPLEH